MFPRRVKDGKSADHAAVRFSLLGLMVFSSLLVVIGGLTCYGLITNRVRPDDKSGLNWVEPSGGSVPAWGELLIRNIELEQPEEYIAFELQTNRAEAWRFNGMTVDQVRQLMLACGVTAKDVEHALSPELSKITETGVFVQPDDELILSLSPKARAKLYGKLGRDPANHYMQYPFCYPGDSVNACLNDSGLDAKTVTLIKSLLYPRGDALCFSDYEWLLQRCPTEADQLTLVKALSRQSVVLLRLHIRRDTDVEKLLGYWGTVPGVRPKDLYPLLDSMRRLEGGGNISVLYLLPQFARQRLYTFPLPSSNPADPVMDCHWSTMNFFNEVPDDRFSDAAYTSRYVLEHFYRVAKPTRYGDIIFVLDKQGNAIHSGVFVCDDIIFTKNGNNFAQPWTLMHMKDLLARYADNESPTSLVAYRNKER